VKSFSDDGFSTIELVVVMVVAGLLMMAITGAAVMIKESKLKHMELKIETFDMAMIFHMPTYNRKQSKIQKCVTV
jgi:prepilin-type N-terminal cleavage/methylation domain-containing protein